MSSSQRYRRWTNHIQLRGEGENEAANGIARDVHSMLDTFNDTTALWAIERFHMKPPPVARPHLLAENRTTVPVDARSNTSSWAAVAATDIPRNNRLVKFRPSDGLKRTVTEDELRVETGDQDLRCIWIYGWTKDKPLSAVTEHISSGAIFSMAFVEHYGAVCVLFQYASAAVAFMDEEADCIRTVGVGLFGGGHEVKYGEAYPENADLQRMAPPINERRRLTFARQQLFTNGMSEERFKKDLFELVGHHNVELVWLFNTGNGKRVPHPDLCLPSDHCPQQRWCFRPRSSLESSAITSSVSLDDQALTKTCRLASPTTHASVL